MRKKAERLAAVEKERDMLEKQLDDVVLERDTIKKDCADADKTIAALESKLTQKEDAIALVAAKDKEIEKMKEARAKEKIDEANEKMNLRRQSAERAKTKVTVLEDKLDTVKAESDALRRDLAAKDKALAELAEKLEASAAAEAALRRDCDTRTAEARRSMATLETTRAELKAREEKSSSRSASGRSSWARRAAMSSTRARERPSARSGRRRAAAAAREPLRFPARRRYARSFPISSSPSRNLAFETNSKTTTITASAKHPSGRNRIPD